MLPRNDDRRTAVCCAVILGVPCLLAAVQVAMMVLVEEFVTIPAVASAIRPLGLFNRVLAGCAAAWGAVRLPGGGRVLTLIAAVSAFVVGSATYGAAFVVLAVLAEILVVSLFPE